VDENARTYARISETSTATNNSEEQIQKILGDFQKVSSRSPQRLQLVSLTVNTSHTCQVLEDVKSVDEKQINELQEKMLKIIGQDL